MADQPGKNRPRVEELRHRIDTGQTGDKVNHPDPAAVPLGADDEAAGRPPSADEVEGALREETRETVSSPGESGWLALWIAMVALVLGIGIAIFLAWLT